MPELSLSAGSVLDLAPADVVECAAATGYDLAGVRLADPRRDAPAVAAALARTGLGLLDVEVVRLGPGPLTDHHRELADAAATVGARFLLTVADHDDEALTVDQVAGLAARLHGSATRVALEPMVFTGLRRRADAERIARAAGVSVLLDPLHLHRAGDDLGTPASEVIGYAQLTDAPDPPSGTNPAHEARHLRVPPGEGGLDLGRFLTMLPADLPLAVEVQSDALLDTAPAERAAALLAATRTVLTRRS
ncbi:sugar phosphate isomerase/epimerase family protein [Actinomycetospora soli]|uniref:sugar phosphate isomerase/epimerase family protein n=1 Tax=Actinomycetospora soli TaxID=2893887 RepID=UPI001E5F7DBD|nr:TIM barrel protein [Actinomycetospora soli]MCD2187899.1 sugar phosphate isomerase/epimerase [Actinomycetospora soli]